MSDTLKDLWPGQSMALLKALHILTQNGGLNADSRRKLKQVQHLAQLIKPAIDAALKDKDQPVLADLQEPGDPIWASFSTIFISRPAARAGPGAGGGKRARN